MLGLRPMPGTAHAEFELIVGALTRAASGGETELFVQALTPAGVAEGWLRLPRGKDFDALCSAAADVGPGAESPGEARPAPVRRFALRFDVRMVVDEIVVAGTAIAKALSEYSPELVTEAFGKVQAAVYGALADYRSQLEAEITALIQLTVDLQELLTSGNAPVAVPQAPR